MVLFKKQNIMKNTGPTYPHLIKLVLLLQKVTLHDHQKNSVEKNTELLKEMYAFNTDNLNFNFPRGKRDNFRSEFVTAIVDLEEMILNKILEKNLSSEKFNSLESNLSCVLSIMTRSLDPAKSFDSRLKRLAKARSQAIKNLDEVVFEKIKKIVDSPKGYRLDQREKAIARLRYLYDRYAESGPMPTRRKLRGFPKEIRDYFFKSLEPK
ncbi:MAG: hypothetical protein JWM20_187 [Patescibacteria group bacterium]|nr:hypothetical protein [Patescibacteria group bacterium]